MYRMRLWMIKLCVLSILTTTSWQSAIAQDRKTQLAEADRLAEQSKALAKQGKNDAAIPLMERAFRIREQVLGPEHVDVGMSLYSVAQLYVDKGDYEQARLLYLRVVEILERALKPSDPVLGAALVQLARMYKVTGDFERAEPLFRRALEIFERSLGPTHVAVGDALRDMALMYKDKRDYARAEVLLERAIRILERSLGPNHPDVGVELGALASLYEDEGNYQRAEPLYWQALGIVEKALGPDHENVDELLCKLAWFYFYWKEDYTRAESLGQRILDIRRRTLDPEGPGVARALGGLAMIYSEKGDYIRAKPLHQQASQILERAYGPNDRDVAMALHNLALLFLYEKDYYNAETLSLRVLKIFEDNLGPNHIDLAAPLRVLARVSAAKGNISQAVGFLSRVSELIEHHDLPILAAGSEYHKRQYLERDTDDFNAVISFNTQFAQKNPGAGKLALTAILRRKGRSLDAMANQIGALRRRLNAQDRVLLDALTAAYSQLATLTLKGVDQGDAAHYRTAVAQLEANKDQLQGEVASRSAEFRNQSLPVTLASVQQAIPKGAALVEWVSYLPYDLLSGPRSKRRGKQYRYAAYVLLREGEPTMVDLGEASPLDRSVALLRSSLANPKSTGMKQAARTLDELVMRPVRKLLGETQALLLSPDGALNLLPFGALVDEQGRYLIENYSISYLTSGRDLLRLQVAGESRETPRVFADPLYDLTSLRQPFGVPQTSLSADANGSNQRSKDFTTQTYQPLPGTKTEGDAISRLFPEANLLTQAKATEAALKKVSRPRILHIATHGFFLTDQAQSATSPERGFTFEFGTDTQAISTANAENPLLRSGLILAGVKQGASGPGEDGVLTALEVSGLDVWGTKLVVLSACETALGDVQNGEGVYGLRRALVLAGSETQVMSLWKVSDAGTRDLMVAYYTRLQKGEGRTEALRQVQLAMLQGKLRPSSTVSSGNQKSKRETGEMAGAASSKDYRHPYYWASFIPSGNWRNLAGQER